MFRVGFAMMSAVSGGLFVSALLSSAPALAATLQVAGPVSVNTGSGFRPVTGTVEVNPGDRILVGNGGSAQIVYSASCSTGVSPGAVATVAASAPCTATTPNVPTNAVLIGAAVAGGVGAAVALSQSGGSTPAPRPASP